MEGFGYIALGFVHIFSFISFLRGGCRNVYLLDRNGCFVVVCTAPRVNLLSYCPLKIIL